MPHKRSKAKSLSLVFAGALIGVVFGGVAATVITARYYQNIVADVAVSQVMWQTRSALRVREGKQTEIAKTVEMNMPNNILMLSNTYPNHRMTASALRNIKFYYQKNNIPIPANIQPILNAAP